MLDIERVSARKLKDLKAALCRARRENPRRGLALIEKLEQLEPREGNWPHRAADLHRRLGDPAAELAALLRAAERFQDAGFVLKAIAVCKRALEIEPEHPRARATLAALAESAGTAPREAAAGRAPRQATSTAEAPADARLDEIVLTEVIASRPPSGWTQPEEGLAEIELPPPGQAREEGEDPSPVLLGGDEPEDPGLVATPRRLSRAPEPPSSAHALGGATGERLYHTQLLAPIPPADLAECLQRAELRSVAEGDVIFSEGDPPGDVLYLIADGAVTLVSETPSRRLLAALAEGEFFGEGALLRDERRNATARAVIDTTLLCLGRDLVSRMIGVAPEVLVVLLSQLRDRLTDRLVRTGPLFSALTRSEQSQLARRFRFLEAMPDTPIVPAGRVPLALFVVLTGTLDVLTGEPGALKAFAELEAGDLFGEMSLLTGKPAMATVRARTKSWLLYLPRAEVEPWLADPRIGPRLAKLARHREAANRASGVTDALERSVTLC